MLAVRRAWFQALDELDVEEFRHGGANVTGFRLVNTSRSAASTKSFRWQHASEKRHAISVFCSCLIYAVSSMLFSYAGCFWASRVQGRRHGVQLPARSSASVPTYIHHLFVELCQPVAGVASRQHLRSATRQLLVVPRHRLSFNGRRAFCVAGPSVWNSLPDSLRNPVIRWNSFRQSLKTFLFATYWCIQRIRGFTTMRYANRLFTYLLAYYYNFPRN